MIYAVIFSGNMFVMNWHSINKLNKIEFDLIKCTKGEKVAPFISVLEKNVNY